MASQEEAVKRFQGRTPEALGMFGERLWANIFASSPLLNYISLHNCTAGGAPMQKGHGDLILPDFDVASTQFEAFVDSKCKTGAVLYRKANQIRHGIDRINWLHYAAIAEQRQRQCFLAIFECFELSHSSQWTGALLLRSLAGLGKPADGFSNQEHMVYWPRSAFRLLGELPPELALAVYQNKDVVPGSVTDSLLDLLESESGLVRERTLF